MQIKTTMRYHLIAVIPAMIQKTDVNKCWTDVKKGGCWHRAVGVTAGDSTIVILTKNAIPKTKWERKVFTGRPYCFLWLPFLSFLSLTDVYFVIQIISHNTSNKVTLWLSWGKATMRSFHSHGSVQKTKRFRNKIIKSLLLTAQYMWQLPPCQIQPKPRLLPTTVHVQNTWYPAMQFFYFLTALGAEESPPQSPDTDSIPTHRIGALCRSCPVSCHLPCSGES